MTGRSVRFTAVNDASDVTDEITDLACDIISGWYSGTKTDWEDVWDRLDGSQLSDGTIIDLGTDLLSPALRELKKRCMA